MTKNISLLGRLRAVGQRVAKSRSGVAMVEFAIVAPVFMSMVLIGLEVANFAIANMRASQIALMVADNAGRVRTTMDETDVDEVMIGAMQAGSWLNLGANGRIILSSVESNGKAAPDTGQMIRWQRCFGALNKASSYGIEGQGTNDNSLAEGVGPVGRKISSVSNSALMFVELRYRYQPLISQNILGEKEIVYTAAYTVRERSNQTLTNLANLPDTKRRVCSRFSAT